MDIVNVVYVVYTSKVVLKRRKRRRVALHFTLKAFGPFSVSMRTENGLRKSKQRSRDFLRRKNRTRVSFIRDGIYMV